MRVLLVYPYLPYPGVAHGSGRLLVPLIQHWRKHAEITLVCGYRPHEQAYIEEARALVHKIHPVLRPARADLAPIGRAVETVRTAYMTYARRDPIHVTKTDRSVFHKAIREARAKTKFDVAQIELAGIARCVVELPKMKTVLVDHEAGVASGGDVHSDARTLAYLKAIYPKFDRVLTVCREDAAELRTVLPKVEFDVRRPGVTVADRRRPSTASGGDRRTTPPSGTEVRRQTTSAGERKSTTASIATGTILFFGSPDHLPNQDAVGWLATDLWPRISRVAPARCVVTGGINSPRLAAVVRAAGIENKGFVPDLASEIEQATVIVCPVRTGRGVRIKNLDALAAGKPLVTTSLGARGLDLVDGDHAMIADGAAEFAAAVVRILKHPDLAERIGATGRSHVSRSFTHEAAASFNLDLWKKLVTA